MSTAPPPPPGGHRAGDGSPRPLDAGGASVAQRISEGLAQLHAGKGDDALAAFAAAVSRAEQIGDAAGLSEALRHQSSVHRQRSEWSEAVALARRAADAARAAGLGDALAQAYNAEAVVHQSRGAFEEAETLLAEAFVSTDNDRVLGAVLANLGSIAAQRGDLEAARTHLVGSARKFRDCHYFLGEATVLNNLGRLGLDQGNARVALPMLQDALGAARRAGDTELVAIVQRNLAEATGLLGDPDAAEQLALTALAAFTAEGNEARRAECLRILGELDEARGNHERAVERWTEALAIANAPPLERERIEARLRGE
jgi:tetratricopeptide (TPR) repeat protein